MEKKRFKLYEGDNIESLKKLPDNSIDSVVTDPPYGLSFMGKKWDYDVPSVDFWKEVHRVLKPGGHVLSFGGTRTYHRMVVNMEDAGFEIRDQIMWIYGSGFPKSLNIGKAVDKLEGNEREVVGEKITGMARHKSTNTIKNEKFNGGQMIIEDTKGQSEWEGWGTSIKPANEPICLARKPLSEKSVAENVLKWKTGGMNIDGCRVGSELIQSSLVKPEKNTHHNYTNTDESNALYDENGNRLKGDTNEGRFPANIIFQCLCDEVIKNERGQVKRSGSRNRERHEYNSVGNFGSKEGAILAPDNYNDKGDIHTNPNCPCYMLDEQSGNLKSTGAIRKKDTDTDATSIDYKHKTGEMSNPYAGQQGGASRFFFQASYNNIERNEYKMKNECQQNNNRLVQYVEPNGLNINQITELIAQTNVEEWLKDKLALFVKSALNQSEKCTMYIVANLVAIATENMASQLTQDFIQDYKNYILIQSLAQIAEIQDNTDTTPTTQNLLKLFGSVLRVIEKNTQLDLEQEKEEQKLGLYQSNYRFAYIPKVSKKERNMGLDHFKEITTDKIGSTYAGNQTTSKIGADPDKATQPKKNNHPTLKPINLMTYLCRLITPANGIVLDPFMGSGSTGISALIEGFRFVGMEMDKDYFKIAEARIENWEEYRKLIK